jgi:hypothetical protein
MQEFLKKLYHEMEEDLDLFRNVGTTPVNRLTGSLNSVTVTMVKIREYVNIHPFSNEAEEIDFFKYQKPRFYRWQIYLVDEYTINNNLPKGSNQMQRSYYLNELAVLERTHNQHRQLYQYFTDNETHRDDEYFLRQNFVPFLPGQDIHPDPSLSTNQDYLFSKFRANQMLQDLLITKITKLETSNTEELAGQFISRRKKRWTGDKINLIEIAYGIYFTGQMNNGKADIKEIISWLETSLHIDLSQAYRMFLDIRRRKTVSYTKFLEQMGAAVRLHIDETHNYKPKKRK